MLKTGLSLLTLMALLATVALAQPKIEISIKTEKEVTLEEDGKQLVKRVATDEIEPDSNLFYVLSYVNSGDEVARNVVITDPIPENTRYVSGSASGDGSEIDFSIDDGKSFKKPSMLTYEVRNKDGSLSQKSASAEQYTHIRWIVESIPPGASGEVGFQVVVK